METGEWVPGAERWSLGTCREPILVRDDVQKQRANLLEVFMERSVPFSLW